MEHTTTLATKLQVYLDYLTVLNQDVRHLLGTYDLLQQWSCSEPVVLAGLFHAIYGTDDFEGMILPLSHRSEIANLI